MNQARLQGRKEPNKKIDHSTDFETGSMIAAPLRKKEKTVGVLEVLNKKKGNFSEEDLTLVTTLTPIIAMALENARMYAELDGAYKELGLSRYGLIKKIQRYGFKRVEREPFFMISVME